MSRWLCWHGDESGGNKFGAVRVASSGQLSRQRERRRCKSRARRHGDVALPEGRYVTGTASTFTEVTHAVGKRMGRFEFWQLRARRQAPYTAAGAAGRASSQSSRGESARSNGALEGSESRLSAIRRRGSHVSGDRAVALGIDQTGGAGSLPGRRFITAARTGPLTAARTPPSAWHASANLRFGTK